MNKYARIPLTTKVIKAARSGDRTKSTHYAKGSIKRFLDRHIRIKAINSRTSKPLPPGEAEFKRELEALGKGKKMNGRNKNIKRPDGYGAASQNLKMGDASLQAEDNINAATHTTQISLANRAKRNMKPRNKNNPEELRRPRRLEPYERPAPGAKLAMAGESTRGGTIGQVVGNNLPPDDVTKLAGLIKRIKGMMSTTGKKIGNSPSQNNAETRNVVLRGLTMSEKAGELSKLFGRPKLKRVADARKLAAAHIKDTRNEFRRLGSVSALDRHTDNIIARRRIRDNIHKFFTRANTEVNSYLDSSSRDSLRESAGFRTSKAIRRDPLKIKIDTLQRRLKILRAQKKANSPEAINIIRQIKDLRARRRSI